MKKVNKVFAILFTLFPLFMLVLFIFNIMPSYIPTLCTAAMSAIIWLLIYKKSNPKYIKLFCIIDVIYICVNNSILFPIVSAVQIIAGLVLIAMYLDKRYMLICSAGLFILEIYAQLGMFANNYKSEGILIPIFIAGGVGLYFICYWGREMVEIAEGKMAAANSLLEEQQITANAIKQSTIILNSEIVKCSTNLKSVQEASEGITKTVEEVTKGVVSEAESNSEINNMMNDAEENISQVLSYSQNLTEVSNVASNLVKEGSEKINKMGKQMSIINNSVTESLSTVEELEINIEESKYFTIRDYTDCRTD